MAIYIGNQKIKDIYFGSQKIKEVYKGSQLVYQAVDPRSYWVSTSNMKSYFDLDNTPIDNFCIVGMPTANLNINGVDVRRNTIQEIKFGGSYSGVTSIPNNFLYQCSNLTSISIGDIDFTGVSVGSSGFWGVSNNSTKTIYASTLELANIFKAKFSNLSNWSVAVG